MLGFEDFCSLMNSLEEIPVQQVYVVACKDKQSWLPVNDVLRQYKFCLGRSSEYENEIETIRLFLCTYFSSAVLQQFEDTFCKR